MSQPLVAVFMVTYNHERYIEQAIESVLMQKTNFPIKLFIGEDCSTDKTASICLKYQKENPEIVEVFISKENIGASKNALLIFGKCFSSKAKYIAMLEGDDYWTDPYKLQKQVNFLEANDDFVICFHNLMIMYEDGRETHLSNLEDQKEVSFIEDLAQGNYIYTASCVFRNGLINEFPEWYNNSPVGDYVIHMLNAKHGPIKYLPEIMAVYRVHKGGTWENKGIIFRVEKWVELLELMKNHFNPGVKKIFEQIQSNHYSILINHYQDNAYKCKHYSKLKIDCDPYSIIKLNKQIEELGNKYEKVLKSRAYKIGTLLLKPYYFIKNKTNA